MSKSKRPTRRRWRIEWSFVALLAAGLLAACGAPVSPKATPQGEPLDCVAMGYPCSFAEMEQAVLQQSMDLAEELVAMLQAGGSVDEALALLAATPGVASAEGAGDSVVFRLEGGRPTVVNLAIDQPLLPEQASLQRVAAGYGLEPLRPSRVVGGGGPKSALVLAAFPFDFGGMDSAAYVAELLAATPDYAGRVTFKASPDADTPLVTVNDLLDLDSYDLVYMTTHGGRLCTDKTAPLKPSLAGADALRPSGTGAGAGDCRTDFLVQRFHGSAADLRSLDHTGIVLYYGSRHRSIAVTADFFRHYYPTGLGDTLFVLLSCSTFADDFTPAVGQGGSGFVSWDGMVDAERAWATADLMEYMLLHGVTVRQALETLGDSGFDAVHGGRLRAGGAAHGMRLIDPLRVDDVFSGADLRTLTQIEVVGTPGDAWPDLLLLEAEVQGVLEDDAADAVLTVTVDGVQRLAGTVAQLGEQQAWARYRLPLEVELGFDAHVGQSLAVEVRLELPEGGSARVAGAPIVAGADTDDLGRVWQGELIRIHTAKAPNDERIRLEADVRFVRDPGDGPDSPYPTFRLAGGSYHFSFEGTDGYSCLVTAFDGGSLQARESLSFTLDRRGPATTVRGWGTSGTPRAEAEVLCPDGETLVRSVDTDYVLLNIPLEEGHTVRGGAFSGSFSHDSALGVTTWSWSFRRVE